MFEGQPKGLWALSFANTGERFGYYTMLAVFILFLQANFGWSSATAGVVYSSFLMLVYFLPLFGGMAADRWGYSKMVTIGIYIMFAGYALLSVPLGTTTVAIVAMAAALVFVSFGTGMFKGNLQVTSTTTPSMPTSVMQVSHSFICSSTWVRCLPLPPLLR